MSRENYFLSDTNDLLMIIPSKWMVGGRGLNSFRDEMINDRRIKQIFDFENSADCFQGIHLDGGVCYFLWDRDYNGMTDYTFKSNDGIVSNSEHYLKNDYFEYIIRDNRILSILQKVKEGERFSEIVSSTKPFGIRKYLFNDPSRYPNSNLQFKPFQNSIKIYGVKGIKGGAKRIVGFITPETVTKNNELIDKYKLFFTTSYSTNAINPPETIIGKPNEICTETFLMIGHFDNEIEQINCLKIYNKGCDFYFCNHLFGVFYTKKELTYVNPLPNGSDTFDYEKENIDQYYLDNNLLVTVNYFSQDLKIERLTKERNKYLPICKKSIWRW